MSGMRNVVSKKDFFRTLLRYSLENTSLIFPMAYQFTWNFRVAEPPSTSLMNISLSEGSNSLK